MRVNFEVGTSGGASAEDALRTLNTELVAGKGPDVLILDGMPLQSFIDKGVLAELSQVISADGLIPQVVDPMRTDGKLYAVPTRFTVPGKAGDAGRAGQPGGAGRGGTGRTRGAGRQRRYQ